MHEDGVSEDAGETPGIRGPGDPAAELARAVELASAFLVSQGHDIASVRITEVRNQLRGSGGGPDAWRVTYKLRHLIPADGSEIGAGGELFVDVDLKSSAVRLGGVGE
jgi:hypothetical protein